MVEYRLSRSVLAAGVIMLAACGRPEPEAPTVAVRDEICSGKRPLPEPTPAELRTSSYTLADLGPEFVSNPPPLAKQQQHQQQHQQQQIVPAVIPALPPLWDEQATIPALPAESAMPTPKPRAEPVALQRLEGLRLLRIDPLEPPYRVRIPEFCWGNKPVSSDVRICVSDSGDVTAVEIVKASLPVLDRQLPDVIGRWKFEPYMLNGVPKTFCFQMDYRLGN
jgi:outer membrane biosynthesis protein TonB